MDTDPYTFLYSVVSGRSSCGNTGDGIHWLRDKYNQSAHKKDQQGMDAVREVLAHFVSTEPYPWIKP